MKRQWEKKYGGGERRPDGTDRQTVGRTPDRCKIVQCPCSIRGEVVRSPGVVEVTVRADDNARTIVLVN